MHNLDKSGFRAGEYVGYAEGAVYNVKKSGRDWQATLRTRYRAADPVSFRRHTLREVSETLATIK